MTELNSQMAGEGVHWYCLRAQTRREHIAAEHVRKLAGVPALCPRMAIKRPYRDEGKKLFIEPVFPAYFFAAFDFTESWRHIKSLPGVTGIVRVGQRIPTLPESLIEEMRVNFGQTEIMDVPDVALNEGDIVRILTGCFRGQAARVASVSNGAERVALLMEFLGQEVRLVLPGDSVIRDDLAPGA